MSTAGTYLYGFANARFQPPADLRGLRGAPVHVLTFRDIAAVVSSHPVQPLMPLRSNLEPHHRVVREISSQATLVPAAFGHISETERRLCGVVTDNYDDIREALVRLDRKCEIGVKLSWNVANIFELLVRQDDRLREARDAIFGRGEPSMHEKLQLGSLFDQTLTRQRERLTAVLLNALERVACDTLCTPPRAEKGICQAALLIERARLDAVQGAVRHAASLFDANFTLEYSGPWPPYSFVRLRLQAAAA
jgi:hypothetical protein